MGRLEVLEKEINKGIAVDEKSNIVVDNWSPNNVRRLIIGFDYAIVQYFVTGGKYRRLMEIVDMRMDAQKDRQAYAQEVSTYKSILGVLTKGRILSSVEEIVFCSKGYPPHLLELDMALAKSGGQINTNRFVRLNHVSMVISDVRTVGDAAAQCREKGQLLKDALLEAGISTVPYTEDTNEDWWKHSFLRPKYYSLDATKLHAYFAKVKENGEEEEREVKLTELDIKNTKLAIDKHLPLTLVVLTMVETLLTTSTKVYTTAGLLDKSEWAWRLEERTLVKGVLKRIRKNATLSEEFAKIDFRRIKSGAKANGIDTTSIERLETIFSAVLNETGTREKHTLAVSLTNLQKLTGYVHAMLVSAIYATYISYLNRNTPKYVEYYYKKLKGTTTELKYTRVINEYCNEALKEEVSKVAFDKTGAVSVPVEQFNVPVKTAETLKILTGLEYVAKEG